MNSSFASVGPRLRSEQANIHGSSHEEYRRARLDRVPGDLPSLRNGCVHVEDLVRTVQAWGLGDLPAPHQREA